MGKRLPYTPNSKIKAALRNLWLRSRERAARLKHDNYTCCKCGVKQSKARGKIQKVEIHHLDGICNWDEIYRMIRLYLLVQDIRKLQTLCPKCHKTEGKGEI